MDDGKIVYSSELDEKEFVQGAERIRSSVRKVTAEVEKSGKQMDSVFDNLGKKVAGAFAVSSLVAFQKKIIEVRGEMESLQKSFQSLAGEHVGKKLYEDIKQFATTTPMMMNDLAKGAKTLLAFNIEAEKVMPILRQIGDISMGDAQKFNSLTLAFAQMSSTGKLMGQDFLQMINAGFNPLVVISEKTGKSVAQLKDEMSKGAITVEMVEDAFRAATSEGGKFNGMLLSQSKTLNGAISNMQGAYQDMLNSIGEAEQGVLMTGVNITTKLLQNYETIGKVLLQLVATYGSYKAAVIAVSLAEEFLNGKYIVKTRLLRAAAVAQELLNNAMLKNPAVLVATAVLSLVSALVIFKNRTDEAAEAHERLNEAFGDTQAKIASEEKKLDDLFGKLRKSVKGTQEYKEAKKSIIDQYGQYFNGLDYEIEKVGGVENAYRKLTQAVRESLMARGKETAMQKATDTYNKDYGEYLSKIYNQVLNQAGEENAKNAVRAIRADLKLTGEVAEDTQRAIKRVADGVNYTWFGKLNEAESTLKKSQQEVNVLFGEQEKRIDTNAQKTKNLGEAYKEAQKNFNEADAMVKKMAKNRSAYTDEQWNEWTERLKKRKEEFEKLGGDPDGKKAKSDSKVLNQQASRNAKSIEQQQQYEELLARMEQDAAYARATANIEAIKNNGERERAERRAEYERQKRDILQQEADIYKTIYEQRKEAYENANKDKKYANTAEGKLGYGKDKNGKFVMAGTLDTNELKLYKAAYSKMMADLDALNSKHNRSETEYQRERIQAMRDYLKEFGTVQQKRLAIQQEYDDKIAEETDEAQRKILEAQKKKALDAFDIEVLKADIDWTTMFDGIGAALEEEMKETLGKIEKYMQSEAFKTSDAKEKAEWVKMRNELRRKTGGGVGTFDFSIYNKIGEDMEAYQQARKEVKEAEQKHTEALKKQKEAAEELEAAEKKLKEARTEEEEVDAKVAVGEAKRKKQGADTQVETTKQAQQNAETKVAQTQGELVDSTTQAQQALDRFGSAIGQMTSGTLRGFADGLVNLIAAIGGEGGNGLSGLGKAGGIIGAILSIIDAMGDDFGSFWEKLLDKIFTVIESSVEQTANNKIADSIISAAVNGIKHIIEAMLKGAEEQLIGGKITHGLDKTLDALGISHSEEEDSYKKMIAEFENLRDIWDEIIDKKREYLNESWGTEAMKAAEEANRIAKEALERARQLANESLDYGASGGSRSIGYRMWEKGSYGDWKGQAQNIVNALEAAGLGRPQFNNMYDLTAMNAQQLAYIRENYRDLWVQLDEDYKNALENIIKYGEEIEQTTEALNQKLTTTTKNNVIDDFKNSLYDLADGEKDVTKKMAEDWQKMVNRMVIDNLVMKRYQADLEAWYQRLADIQRARNAGEFASDEEYRAAIEGLRREYEGIMADAQQDIAEMTEFGLIGAVEEAKEYFKDLRDTWKSMLTGMETDAEAFKENLQRVMFEDLVSSLLLDDDFTAWLDDWRERYKAVIEDTTLTVEQREAAINGLLKEQLDKREAIAGQAEELAEGLGIIKKTFTDMRSTWLESLTDMETDAETFVENIRMALAKQLVEKIILGSILSDRIKGWESQLNELFAGDYTNDYITREIDRIGEEMGESFEEASGDAKQLFDALGIKKEQDSPFKDMRSLFADTLTDMEEDAEEFRKKINQTVTKGLIETFIDNYKINGTAFKDWADKWNEAYTAAIAAGNTKEADRLLKELMKVREAMVQGADEYRKRLEDIAEDTTIKDMGDNFISSLMDETETAEDWAKELGKTMAQKIIKQMVSATMIQPLLDNIQTALNTAMNAEGATYKSVLLDEGLRNDIEALKKKYPQLKELVQGIMESFGVVPDVEQPLGDLRDTIINGLTDIEGDAEKFGKDIATSLMRQMTERMLDDRFGEQIKTVREHWQKALEGEEGFTLEIVRQEIAALYEAIGNDDEVKKLTGDIKELNEVADDTFSGLTDSLTSSLMDMEAKAADFGEDIGKTLAQKIVSEMIVGKQMQKYLDNIQKAYDKAFGAEGATPESVIEAILPLIRQTEEAYDALKPYVDSLMKQLNIGTYEDQDATANMADKATYDQFEQYLGIATAQQIAIEQGNSVRQQILATLQGMANITRPDNNAILTQVALANSHLQLIRDYSKKIQDEVVAHMTSIDTKLTNLNRL